MTEVTNLILISQCFFVAALFIASVAASPVYAPYQPAYHHVAPAYVAHAPVHKVIVPEPVAYPKVV